MRARSGMTSTHIWIVFVAHAYIEGNVSSIYVCTHESEPDDDELYPVYDGENNPQYRKVCGPIPCDEAKRVREYLINLLSWVGYEVHMLSTADD